jgi:deoxyribodipyrimidine photo-lyase
MIEAVADLSRSIEKLGSSLQVHVGDTTEILSKLVAEYGANAIFAEAYHTYEEQIVQEKVEAAVWKQQVTVVWEEGNTMVHSADLPFPIAQLPNIFTEFRKAAEREVRIRPLAKTPHKIKSRPLPATVMPTLVSLGYSPTEIAKLTESGKKQFFEGGETAGLDRVQEYLWDTNLIETYKETRNGLIGNKYSTKFSAWLAFGCISARFIYHEVRKYEREICSNDSTYWVIFELYWRDYFAFVARKFGTSIFLKGGIKQQITAIKTFKAGIDKWIAGDTGNPFVDANMRELALTGFMSNRGRQNVASYFVKDLKQDWRIGAAYFEEQLIDYDVCSNWGNWNYVAGIGNDPREDRYFNTYKQASMYDAEAKYIKRWVPELAALTPVLAIKPHTMSKEELKKFGIVLGTDYPLPLVKITEKAW